jgi:hypothetical protein
MFDDAAWQDEPGEGQRMRWAELCGAYRAMDQALTRCCVHDAWGMHDVVTHRSKLIAFTVGSTALMQKFEKIKICLEYGALGATTVMDQALCVS